MHIPTNMAPKKNLYLDYNATAPLLDNVRAAIQESLHIVGNASSTHHAGRHVRQLIETSRTHLGHFFGLSPKRIIFTSGATESNNLALRGFQGPVIVGATEHDSVFDVRADKIICPVDDQGIIDLNALEHLIKTVLQTSPQPPLVSIMAANNETGAIQPLAEIVDLVKRYDGFVHCDAVQAVGKLSLNWAQLGVDMISLSGHKIGGLQGIGALFVHEKLPLTPQMRGGGQEFYHRAGTENVLGIIAFGHAIQSCSPNNGQDITANWQPIAVLRDELETQIQSFCPSVQIFSKKTPRLPNTTNLTMPGINSALQVMAFDLAGIAVSAGSACSSGKVKSSRVLKAMGVDDAVSNCALRISLGPQTTRDDIQRFIAIWQQQYDRSQTHFKNSSCNKGAH